MENEENKIADENLNSSEEEKVIPEETVVQEENPTPAKATEPTKEEEVKEEVETEGDAEPTNEEPATPSAEEDKTEEEQQPKKPTEDKPEVEDKTEEEGTPEGTIAPEEAIEQLDPTQEDLMAQLEELRTEKEEREALEACNIEVMKVEREFQDCSNKIAQALKDSFAQNGIDSSKTMEELKKEDPAKATLAMQFIAQAQELKAQLENAAVNEISKHQNEVIYRAASREFEKMGLNLEQAKEAVKTFKRIVNEVGVVDLKEDLQMKVQLAAGRAKIVVPEGIITPKVEPAKATGVADDVDTTEVKDSSPEIKEVVEEITKKEKEEVPPTPVVEKPKVEDFEEGVGGKGSSGAGTIINELNVLEELAKLPYKERAKFYKEHEDSIAKALSKRG